MTRYEVTAIENDVGSFVEDRGMYAMLVTIQNVN